jgi:hypothetical protein
LPQASELEAAEDAVAVVVWTTPKTTMRWLSWVVVNMADRFVGIVGSLDHRGHTVDGAHA